VPGIEQQKERSITVIIQRLYTTWDIYGSEIRTLKN